MEKNDRHICDLCKGHNFEISYRVPGSKRGAEVAICKTCGLVQSFFTENAPSKRAVSVSAGADWGNIRYGKSFRTKKHVELLDKYASWKQISRVLDVGSNRGSFVHSLAGKGDFSITAVEPDAVISPDFSDCRGVTLLQGRIETVSLPSKSYDLIYMSHTFEHLDSPFDVLHLLSVHSHSSTYLLLEVPNLAFITRDDVIEEFFIDKHTFHFNRYILRKYLALFGWNIVYENDATDTTYITVLASFSGTPNPVHSWDAAAAQEAIAAIHYYIQTKAKNASLLQKAARHIESMYPARIVIWGAGRLFDSLVRVGQLDLQKVHAVVDSYLPQYIQEVNCQKILKPNDVHYDGVDTLIIMSREYASEIVEQAHRLGYHGKVITYQSLLESL